MHSQAELHPSHQLRVLEMFGREAETILGKKPGGQCPSYLVLLLSHKIIPKRSANTYRMWLCKRALPALAAQQGFTKASGLW